MAKPKTNQHEGGLLTQGQTTTNLIYEALRYTEKLNKLKNEHNSNCVAATKAAKHKRERCIVLAHAPFKEDKTNDRCVIFGFDANGKFIVGESNYVHKHNVGHERAYSRPWRKFKANSDVEKFLSELSVEHFIPGNHNEPDMDIVVKAKKAFMKVNRSAREYYVRLKNGDSTFLLV